MKFFRKILKTILSILAKWAIKKHDIELVVVTGFHGSEIVREGIYEILNQKYKVRRNVNEIIWDMSLPLAVLGYKDSRRNILEWLILISRASVYLLLGPKNKHILILNANCTYEETASFWASFLRPDFLIILNYTKESPIIDALIRSIKPEKTKVIYNGSEMGKDKLCKKDSKNSIKSDEIFVFADEENPGKDSTDLIFNKTNRKISYKNSEITIPVIVPKIFIPHIAGIFAFAVTYGFSLEEAGLETLKFDLGNILTKRIKEKIGKEGAN